MASVKKLKKQLKILALDLLDELTTYTKFHPGTDEKLIRKIKSEILSTWNTYIHDINALKKQKDNKDIKKQFSNIIAEIKNKMIPLLDQLSK